MPARTNTQNAIYYNNFSKVLGVKEHDDEELVAHFGIG